MARKTLILTLAASVMTVAACDGDGADTIGARGGVLVSPDGKLVLEVPEGALDRDVFATIGEIDDCADDLDRCYEIEPFGTILRLPAKITYHYDLEQEARVVEEDLALVGRRDDGWARLADRRVDVESGTVAATTMSFSSYTISAGY